MIIKKDLIHLWFRSFFVERGYSAKKGKQLNDMIRRFCEWTILDLFFPLSV